MEILSNFKQWYIIVAGELREIKIETGENFIMINENKYHYIDKQKKLFLYRKDGELLASIEKHNSKTLIFKEYDNGDLTFTSLLF